MASAGPFELSGGKRLHFLPLGMRSEERVPTLVSQMPLHPSMFHLDLESFWYNVTEHGEGEETPREWFPNCPLLILLLSWDLVPWMAP